MQKHVDNIVDPDDKVKHFLRKKKALKISNLAMFLIEFGIIVGLIVALGGEIT